MKKLMLIITCMLAIMSCCKTGQVTPVNNCEDSIAIDSIDSTLVDTLSID